MSRSYRTLSAKTMIKKNKLRRVNGICDPTDEVPGLKAEMSHVEFVDVDVSVVALL